MTSDRRAGLRRLKSLVKKEAWQIIRDPSSIAIAFVLPMVLLLIFGYGVSLDATHVPIALVVENPSPQTIRFTAAFDHERIFFAPALPRHPPGPGGHGRRPGSGHGLASG